MGEIKLGTNGYWKGHSEVLAEGKGYDGNIIGLWDIFGEDDLGVTCRTADCRLVGVAPLVTIEARDTGPEPWADGPLR